MDVVGVGARFATYYRYVKIRIGPRHTRQKIKIQERAGQRFVVWGVFRGGRPDRQDLIRSRPIKRELRLQHCLVGVLASSLAEGGNISVHSNSGAEGDFGNLIYEERQTTQNSDALRATL